MHFHISESSRLEWRWKSPFSVNMGYVFHMKDGLSLFLDLYIFQWLGTANAFDDSSVYFPRLGCHHM